MKPEEDIGKRWQSSAILLIGGSAGSFRVLFDIVNQFPPKFQKAVVIVIHRAKNYMSELSEMLGRDSHLPVVEISDKDRIEPGVIYIAPPNYHTLFENDGTFSLDVSDAVLYSRPSIDVAFESAADCCGERCTALLLSGANKDGARGMLRLKQAGALTIVQDPNEAEMPEMPQAAIDDAAVDRVLTTAEILDLLRK